MYRTRRMRNRRSGRSKRGGETNEKKAIKIALGITPETQIDPATHSKERAALFAKLNDPVVMQEILNTWDSLSDDSVYNEADQRYVGRDLLYVLTPRQQELASEFMGSSGLGRFFKTGHPDRKTFYTALIKALRTPDYLVKLKKKIEDDTSQFKEIGAAHKQYLDTVNLVNAPAGVEQQQQQPHKRISAVATRVAREAKQDIHETTDADSSTGVSSTAVFHKNPSPKQVVTKQVANDDSAGSMPPWKLELLKKKQAAAERQRQEVEAERQRLAAAAAAEAAAKAEAEAKPVIADNAAEVTAAAKAAEPPLIVDATAAAAGQAAPAGQAALAGQAAIAPPALLDIFEAGKSRRRHRRSHRRSNKKSRKGRKTRKSRRRHHRGRR